MFARVKQMTEFHSHSLWVEYGEFRIFKNMIRTNVLFLPFNNFNAFAYILNILSLNVEF